MGDWIMSSIALIDRRCLEEDAAATLAGKVAHVQVIDNDEQGLSVLAGLLSAYPTVETLHIMVDFAASGDCRLGHSLMTAASIHDYRLPVCDEMTIIVHATRKMEIADLECLCDSLRQATGAVIMNGLHNISILGGNTLDGQHPLY